MEEIFEIIKAVNRLGDKVNGVNDKIDLLLDGMSQSPSRELSDQYINEETASAILKKSVRTLQKLRRAGSLSFMRVGKKVLYKTSDLKAYLETNYSGT